MLNDNVVLLASAAIGLLLLGGKLFSSFLPFLYHDDVTLFTPFNLNHQNCWAFWPAVGSAVLPADLSKKKKALLIKEVFKVSSYLLISPN